MVVTVASSAFRGGPSATLIAQALGRGARAAGPNVCVREFALSDGGDGAIRALAGFSRGREIACSVLGPDGRGREVPFRLMADGTALVEMAAASGLGLVPSDRRNPMLASTRGTGELIAAAVKSGANAVLLGAGGSATTDMGTGALSALGLRFHDRLKRELRPRLADLDGVWSVSSTAAQRALGSIPITVLSDVDTPLAESLTMFGGQKGFGAGDRRRVTLILEGLERAFGFPPGRLLGGRWLGAGGGIAAGFFAALGASVESGSSWFIGRSGVREAVAQSDLVLTAEGKFDRGSLAGKLPFSIASTAAELGVPVTLIAASVTDDVRPPPPAQLVDLKLPPKEPGNRLDAALEDGLRATAAQAVRVRLGERLESNQERVG